jgi:hypothetical protein
MNLCTIKEATHTRCCVKDLTTGGNCIGNACMAWRFVQEKVQLTDEQVRNAGKAVHLAHVLQPDLEPARGYCGLAGGHRCPTPER